MGNNIPLRYFAETPPGFEGLDFLYLSTLFSLLLVCLLTMEWMWRLVWSLIETPAPLRHPGTGVRWCIIFILLGGFIRLAPNVFWLMFWNEMSPRGRWWSMQADALLDTISFIPFSLAWLIGYLGGPMIVYQLNRQPLPMHLWPTADQIKRPLKIGVGVMGIAFAVVYLR